MGRSFESEGRVVFVIYPSIIDEETNNGIKLREGWNLTNLSGRLSTLGPEGIRGGYESVFRPVHYV